MTPLGAALRRINESLTRASVPFALVGGLAVSVRTEPRFTRDIDLVVAATTDAAAEVMVRQLVSSGWRVAAVSEQHWGGQASAQCCEPVSSHSGI